VSIKLADTRVGDSADVVFDETNGTLTVNVDASQTTANTIIAAIAAEGTFVASLDTSDDPTNDGSGIVGTTGLIATTGSGSAESLQGEDVNPRETKGVFNTLLRLSAAIEDFDLTEIERAASMLDDDFRRLNFARAELGSRGRAFDAIERRVEDEEVELRATLSNEIDADMVRAISELAARQTSLEASLRVAGGLMQTTLMDFL
jgi:flagellin-like hook-associated protein FlgL